MKPFTRRDLLTWFGAATTGSILGNPYSPFFEALKNGLIQKANAQSTGGNAKNFLLFLQYGAPPRWVWDGFLNPTGQGTEFFANGSVKNVITSAGQNYTGNNAESGYQNAAVYNYKKLGVDKAIYMPKLWDITLPYYTGSTAVVDSNSPLMRMYLQNAMIIRGVSMGVDIGHLQGPELISRPSPSKTSLTGAVAEMNRGKFPAIGVTGSSVPYLGYKSMAQIPIAIASGGSSLSPANEVLEPFLLTPSGNLYATNKGNEALMEAAMQGALKELKDYAAARMPGSEVLFDTSSSSEQMFQDAVNVLGNVNSNYNIILNKYKAVVAKCKTAFPGLIPVPADFTSHTDSFAGGFAMAEYMIKNNLSTCFTFDCGNNVSPGSIVDDSNVSTKLFVFNDEHMTGDRQASIICQHFSFRAFMACLHLFRQNIGDSAWNNTVVQLGSEYGRSPRNDGTGTDHAPSANVTTVFSGAIKQFVPMGNIVKNSQSSPYTGTWGSSAPTVVEGVAGAVNLTNEMAVNTVGALIGVKPIIDSAPTLVKFDGANWVGKTEDPKNV